MLTGVSSISKLKSNGFFLSLRNGHGKCKLNRRLYSNGGDSIPIAVNEPILGFRKGSEERLKIQKEIESLKSASPHKIHIDNSLSKKFGQVRIPHDHKKILAEYQIADEKDIDKAIQSALEARKHWAGLAFEERARVILKFAELISTKYRHTINASTVLGQSKNYFQAEIDAACETIDFMRFNVKFAEMIYKQQPESSKGVWNRMNYRPLEGFVYAVTPFNFTAIAANLVLAPVLMGNTVVWKPSDYALFSNHKLFEIMKEAGIPEGVVNFLPGDPIQITKKVLDSPHFAGLHYTGSTQVFQDIWKQIGNNISKYRNYPRIVGETGGKDFVFAHHSADVDALATALIRGAFEFAGQKCSAASRAYVPASLWPTLKQKLVEMAKELKVGNPEEASTFVNAVIHKRSFDNIMEALKTLKSSEVLVGGTGDDTKGYFIQPTIAQVDMEHPLMKKELFGPVLLISVYPDGDMKKALDSCNSFTPYALTGSFFGRDVKAINEALSTLENAAGNFYINDKPTGAVVGQQPFGGSRLSGTNDKAGSYLNLLRWTSPQTIKETFVPPTHPLYPYMDE